MTVDASSAQPSAKFFYVAFTGLGSPIGTKLADLFAAPAAVVAEAAPVVMQA